MSGQTYLPQMWDATLAHEARTELNDAIDRNNETALAKWARKWGHGMLEECGTGESDQVEDLKEEIDDLEAQTRTLEKTIEGYRKFIKSLEANINAIEDEAA